MCFQRLHLYNLPSKITLKAFALPGERSSEKADAKKPDGLTSW